MNQSLPKVSALHIFPEISDPNFILSALNEWRHEWDESMDQCEELTQFRNPSTRVHRLVNKSVMGTSCREFIDKKLFFHTSEMSDVEESQSDEIYMWVTSTPNEVYQLNPKYTRADSLLGMYKIGHMEGSPGCYVYNIS